MARLLIAAMLLALPAAAQKDEFQFVSGLSEYQSIRGMLPDYLHARAMALIDERGRAVAEIRSTAALEARRARYRERLRQVLGGFPERTPLNARTVAVVERDGYRVEKVIFESQPRFYVTANLYLPARGTPPYPAILYPLGHEPGAKAYPVWQQMLGTFARKGYVALTWDPVGQGERVQIWDEDLGELKLRASTTEHTIQATQCLLVGDHLARYTIWDGIRALDYLLSRKEVDPARVGLTGNSGGGTHTSYIGSLEDRIAVAAPSCYITSWKRMLESIGPQDGEQNFPYWLRDGFDYADFIYGFGVKPFLILSGIRDFFPIGGARETFAEVQRTYAAIGAADRVAFFEADDGHGYNPERRMAAYRWFGRWLKGAEEHEPEVELRPATEEELFCTDTGQVATSLGGEDVFSLNRGRAREFRAARAGSPREAIARARELSGFAAGEGKVEVKSYGTLPRPGYRVEKLVYTSEPGILIPALAFVPEGGAARKPAVLFVDAAGKSASADDIESLVKAGSLVLSIDARGLGETQPAAESNRREYPGIFGDYRNAMTALLVGKTMVGMRAGDIVRGIDVLAARADVDGGRIAAFGKGPGAVALLHAAAFDTRIGRVALEDMLVSYEAVVERRIHFQVFDQVVPGALRHYDLPALVAALAPRPVWLVNAVDPVRHTLRLADVRGPYAAALKAGALRIASRRPDDAFSAVYGGMLE